jgi:hypothetical protein
MTTREPQRPTPGVPTGKTPLQRVARLIIISSCVFIGAMWFYAFVFASKESVNRIKDEAWAARAQTRCEQAYLERSALANLNRVDRKDPASLAIRADLVDRATDSLEAMLNDIAAVVPNDEKGQAIVPLWVADYRTYIENRRDYANELRTGRLTIFSETQIDGVPVSERVGKFARENRMRACQPPVDLVV